MQDLEKILDELQVPEVTTKTHQKLLHKHLLNNFVLNQKTGFGKGGELFMKMQSNVMLRRFAVGAAALFLIIYGAINYNPFTLIQKANAQELVKKALAKVESLPQNEQEKLGDEKDTLKKAIDAHDLHVESSSQTSTGTKITKLKFTDSTGHTEEIEIDEDDLPVVNPSVTPAPSNTPSGTPSASPVVSVAPSTSPAVSPTHSVIRGGGEREDEGREGVRGVSTQGSVNAKVNVTSQSSENESEGNKTDSGKDD